MAGDFDNAAYDALAAQGLSQRKIARRLKIPRSTSQDALKRRQSVSVEVVPVGPPNPPSPPRRLTAVAMLEEHEMEAMKADLWEMVEWWRSRKLRSMQPRRERATVRWTVHIDPQLKEKIMAESDARRLSLTDTVDLIVRQYFEGEGI
jgi:transposase